MEVDASRRRRRSEVEVLAQEGAAVVERAPIPRRRVRALDVGDDARTAVGAGERLRVLGACVEIKSLPCGFFTSRRAVAVASASPTLAPSCNASSQSMPSAK